MKDCLNRREVFRASAALAVGSLFAASPAAAAIDPIKRNGASKIKLGCVAYSFRDQLTGKKEPAWTLDDFIDFCAKNNLDGAELTGYYFPKEITTEYLNHVKAKMYLNGLEVSGTSTSCVLTLPPGAERDKQIANVKQWVDHAVGLRAPCVRIFSGSVPKDHTEEDARRWFVECVEECCRYSGERGVFLALENHGGISATAEGVLAIAHEVRSPWFGINLDTGNFSSADPYAELTAVAPYAITTHIKTEVTPAGSAKQPADLKRVIQILRAANYRGYVSIEYEAAEDPNTALPRHLAELRTLIG